MSLNIDSVFGATCPSTDQFPGCKATGTNPTVTPPAQGGTAANFNCANGATACCATKNPATTQVKAQDCNNVNAGPASFQCANKSKNNPACQGGQSFSNPLQGATASSFMCASPNVAVCCNIPVTQTGQSPACEPATAASLLKCPTADKKFAGCQSKGVSSSPVNVPSSGDGTSGFSCQAAATPVCCSQTVPAQGLKDSTGCSPVSTKNTPKKR